MQCKGEVNRVPDQEVINGVYEELVEVMQKGLVEVSKRKVGGGQLWCSRELVRLRNEFHRAERVVGL